MLTAATAGRPPVQPPLGVPMPSPFYAGRPGPTPFGRPPTPYFGAPPTTGMVPPPPAPSTIAPPVPAAGGPTAPVPAPAQVFAELDEVRRRRYDLSHPASASCPFACSFFLDGGAVGAREHETVRH